VRRPASSRRPASRHGRSTRRRWPRPPRSRRSTATARPRPSSRSWPARSLR
jgi:hypothetical protein